MTPCLGDFGLPSMPETTMVKAARSPDHTPLKWRLIVDLLGAPSRVLDCGCGSGDLGAFLAGRGFEVTGVEADAARGAQARAQGLNVILGSLEDEGTWSGLSGGFTAIVFSDVLEHLRDPAWALGRARRRLDAGGSLVMSIPNVAFWKLRMELLLGRWDYADEGILDRTHLRFFTLASMSELIRECALEVDRIVPLPGWRPGLGRTRATVHALGAALRPSLLAAGFIVRARVSSEG